MSIFTRANELDLYKYLKLITYLTLLAILAYLFFHTYETSSSLVADNLGLLLITTLFAATALINQTQGYKKLIKKKIPTNDLVNVWATASLINYIGPLQPGLAARSLLLKRNNITIKESATASVTWASLNLLCGLVLFGLLAAIFYYSYFIKTIVIGMAIFSFATYFSLKRYKNLLFKISIKKKLYLPESRHLISSTLNVVIQYAIMVLTYTTLYENLAPSTDLIAPILLAIVIPISTIISITPNGVGIIEGIMILVGANYNISNETNVALIIILRTSHILSCTLAIAITYTLKKLTPTNEGMS